MGQYYLTVNLDKKEYLDPHKFGDGLKLLEFGCSQLGTMTALAILLADGNARGGGDLRSTKKIIGSWAGDRIVIAGDYADPGKFIEDVPEAERQKIAETHYSEGYQEADRVTLYAVVRDHYTDVSAEVLSAMKDDPWMKEELRGA